MLVGISLGSIEGGSNAPEEEEPNIGRCECRGATVFEVDDGRGQLDIVRVSTNVDVCGGVNGHGVR